jgi:hypothetical protein
MNYPLIYLQFIDQIIENHDKHRDPMQKVLKSFVPKIVPQPWMPSLAIFINNGLHGAKK